MDPEYKLYFIGAGIASLYAAYTYLKAHPGAKIRIFEKSDRIGGRAHDRMFEGVSVHEGAGVGRFRKDKLLRQLMTELGLPIHRFRSHHNRSRIEPLVSIPDVVKILKAAAADPKYSRRRHTLTFREMASSVLGRTTYEAFVTATGYRDYENADFIDTLYHYGFDDTIEYGTHFSVPWNLLIQRLADAIGRDRIVLNTEVRAIDPETRTLYLHTPEQPALRYEQLVIGATIHTVRKLLPRMPVFHGIQSQPFLRIYAKIQSKSVLPSSYTLVPGPLQKVIPVNPEQGIYMIAYTDNQHALELRKKTKAELEKVFFEATGSPVKIRRVFSRFWEEGTHYYTPLPASYKTRTAFVKDAQHPAQCILVIGEAVAARYQGWTEGALESVESIKKELIA